MHLVKGKTRKKGGKKKKKKKRGNSDVAQS